MSETVNLIEQGVRQKLRFKSKLGNLTIEDLFDLTLEQLDPIAVAYNKLAKEDGEESFIKKSTKKDNTNKLAFDIVKLVIDEKLEDAEKQKLATAKAKEKQFLLELINQKETSALGDLSIEELKQRVSNL